MMKILGYWLISLLLIACATQPPAPISRIPVQRLSIAQVGADVEQFLNKEVRWGGMITRVDNKPTHTWIELVSRPLDDTGRPIADGHSSGRFIAKFIGFADPEVYKVGQRLTVLGNIEGQVKRLIGQYEYGFPLVAVTSHYLWPMDKPVPRYEPYPPWWYYDPWPFYPWPYRPYYW